MKWVVRTWIFGITLVIGLGTTAALDLFLFASDPVAGAQVNVSSENTDPVVNGTGVRVTYVGWDPGTSEMQPNLKFRIHNDSWQPLIYWAHSPTGLFAELKLNGERIETFRCGTGMTEHYLLPGESIVANVSRYEFTSRPAPTDLLTAGFYLRRPFADESLIYRSEPMTLPEEFRMSIETR